VKYTFTLIYELDTTVACAVATYLDIEHYVFLHKKYLPHHEVVEKDGRRVKIKQTWHFGKQAVTQYCWTEYDPPARFLNYEISTAPWWVPSVHHVMKTRTELRYYPDATGTKTVSHLTVDLELPFWLWPLRKVIEKRLCELKIEKDSEDMAMISRREKLFGRGNVKSYLVDHQFMLHKEDFIAHFGQTNAHNEAAAG
jgi:hypothetical protein